MLSLLVCLLFGLGLGPPLPSPLPAPPSDPEPDPAEDRLGTLVVEATPGEDDEIRLPVLAVATGGSRASATQPWFRVLRRDLELYGGFAVRDAAADEDGRWLSGAAAGVALLGLQAGELPSVPGAPADPGAHVRVRVQGPDGSTRWEKVLTDRPADDRAAHTLTDEVLEALTGHRGGFASRLAFARTTGSLRRIHALDVDGRNAEIVSGPDEVALAPTFDSDGRLLYASSVDRGRYRVRVAGRPDTVFDLGGSVYGLALSRDGRRAAAAVARGSGIHLLVGSAGLGDLRRRGEHELVMHPAFGPRGRLAWVAELRGRTRVVVDGRPVSKRGVPASAPVFCDHPERPRLLWTERVGRRFYVVRADADGHGAERISAEWGDARWPACSPDGRMVAFFSKGRRRSGLWIANVEVFRPRRISSLVGDSLRWSDRL